MELWRHEDAANAQRRARELLDRANAFGDEETLPLAGFAPPEVPG